MVVTSLFKTQSDEEALRAKGMVREPSADYQPTADDRRGSASPFADSRPAKP
jgi:hypothetical protein